MINRKIRNIKLDTFDEVYATIGRSRRFRRLYTDTARLISDNNITRFARRPFAGAKEYVFVQEENWYGDYVYACKEYPGEVFLCIDLCRKYGLVGKNTKKFSIWAK